MMMIYKCNNVPKSSLVGHQMSLSIPPLCLSFLSLNVGKIKYVNVIINFIFTLFSLYRLFGKSTRMKVPQ